LRLLVIKMSGEPNANPNSNSDPIPNPNPNHIFKPLPTSAGR